MSTRERAAAAAIIQDSIQNPPTHVITEPVIYNVDKGTNPTWIDYNGIGRLAVKIDICNTNLGTSPIEVKFTYRTYGAPNGTIRVGIRKASDDSFQLIAEHPVEFNPALTGKEQTALIIIGDNSYALVADDKISIEYPSNATSGISLPSNGVNLANSYTSQSHDGTVYLNTANALAVSIKAAKSTPI